MGTSYGTIFVFDHLQDLLCKLSVANLTACGPVTALANNSAEWLVAGHAKGQLVLWNLETRTLSFVLFLLRS